MCKYFEYIWYEEKVEKIGKQTEIIEKLSDSLKEELLLEANGPLIRDLKMFTLNFSEELLRSMIPLLKEVRYMPGDILFMKEDHDEEDIALYVIRKGKIEIFLEDENSQTTVLKTLKKGDSFGEIAFFSNAARSTCARSSDFTTLCMIKQKDFLHLLKKFPEDYYKYCEIKDQINLYDDYKSIFLKCYSCNDINHLVQSCSKIKYKPLKDIIIAKHLFPVDQIRRKIIRRNFRCNALKKFTNIEKNLKIFQNNVLDKSDDEIDSYSDSSQDHECSFDSEKKTIVSKEEIESSLFDLPNPSSITNLDVISENKEISCDRISRRNSSQNNINKPKFYTEILMKKPIGKRSTYNSSTSNSIRKSIEIEEESNENSESRNNSDLKKIFCLVKELKDKIEENQKNMQKSTDHLQNINEKKDKFTCIDSIKSWRSYFPSFNCENIVNNDQKKPYSATYNSFYDLINNEKRKAIFENSSSLHTSKFYEEILMQKSQNSPKSTTKKKYFQNPKLLEKFLKEEIWDHEKIRSEFKQRYRKNQKFSFTTKIKKIKKFFFGK